MPLNLEKAKAVAKKKDEENYAKEKQAAAAKDKERIESDAAKYAAARTAARAQNTQNAFAKTAVPKRTDPAEVKKIQDASKEQPKQTTVSQPAAKQSGGVNMRNDLEAGRAAQAYAQEKAELNEIKKLSEAQQKQKLAERQTAKNRAGDYFTPAPEYIEKNVDLAKNTADWNEIDAIIDGRYTKAAYARRHNVDGNTIDRLVTNRENQRKIESEARYRDGYAQLDDGSKELIGIYNNSKGKERRQAESKLLESLSEEELAVYSQLYSEEKLLNNVNVQSYNALPEEDKALLEALYTNENGNGWFDYAMNIWRNIDAYSGESKGAQDDWEAYQQGLTANKAQSIRSAEDARAQLKAKGYTDEQIGAFQILYKREKDADFNQNVWQPEIDKLTAEHPVGSQIVSELAFWVQDPANALAWAQQKIENKKLKKYGLEDLGANQDNTSLLLGQAHNDITQSTIRDQNFNETEEFLYTGLVSTMDTLILMVKSALYSPLTADLAAISQSGSIASSLAQRFPNTYPKVARALEELGFSKISAVGGASFGLSAAGDVLRNNDNLTAEQAVSTATAAAIFEGLFESLSIGNLNVFDAKKLPKNLKGALYQIFVQNGIPNASEETLTELANIVYDAAANGTNSEWSQLKAQYIMQGMSEDDALKQAIMDKGWQTVEAGVGGYLQGALLGGAGIGINTARQSISDSAGGARIGSTSPAEIYQQMKAEDSTKQGKKTAEAVKNSIEGKSLSRSQQEALGNDIEAQTLVDDAINAKNKQTAGLLEDVISTKDILGNDETVAKAEEYRNRIAEGGEISDRELGALQREHREAMEAYISGEEATAKEIAEQISTDGRSKTENRKLAEAVRKSIAGEALTENERQAIETDSSVQELLKNREESRTGRLNELMQNAYDRQQRKQTKEITNESKLNVTNPEAVINGKTTRLDGQNIKDGTAERFNGIFSEDGELKIKAGDGKTYTLAEAAENIKDADLKALYRKAATLNEAQANLLIDSYDGETYAPDVIKAFNTLIKLGEVGTNLRQLAVRYDAIEDGIFTEEQKQRILDQGLLDREKKPGVTDFTTRRKSTFERIQISLLNKIAESSGHEFIIFDELHDRNLGVRLNGAMAGDNRILLALNAKRGLLLSTAAHEQGHFVKKYNPEGFKRLSDMVLEKVGSPDMKQYQAYIDAGLSEDDIKEELVCDSLYGVYSEKGFISNLVKSDKPLAKMLAKAMDKFIGHYDTAIKSIAADTGAQEFKALEADAELMKKVRDTFLEELSKASENYKAQAPDFITENADGEMQINYSIASFDQINPATGTSQRDELLGYLGKKYGSDTAHDMVGYIDKLADTCKQVMQAQDEDGEVFGIFSNWSKTELLFDDQGHPIFQTDVQNGEYNLNQDFSRVCKKRRQLNAILQVLAADKDFRADYLTKESFVKINNIIRKHDFEIACALCFVDAKRYRVVEWAQSLEGTYNAILNSVAVNKDDLTEFLWATDSPNTGAAGITIDASKPISIPKFEDGKKKGELNFESLDELINKKGEGAANANIKAMARLIRDDDRYRHRFRAADVIAAEGFDTAQVSHPALRKIFDGWGGSSVPKPSTMDAVYDGSILSKGKYNKEAAYAMGGARVNSFSDFMGHMFFDYCQMFAEYSAKEMPVQSYTKELDFARLYGKSGGKINQSGIAAVRENALPMKADAKKGISKSQAEKNREAEKRFAGLDVSRVLEKTGKTIFQLREKDVLENAGLVDFLWAKESINMRDAVLLQTGIMYDRLGEKQRDSIYAMLREGKVQDALNAAGKDNVDREYSRHLGTIVVGVSDAHVRLLLRDPTIRMVIPYHRSGLNAAIAEQMKISAYNDYTKQQTTGIIYKNDSRTRGSLSNKKNKEAYGIKDFDFYKIWNKEKNWVFADETIPGAQSGGDIADGRYTAAAYIDFCRNGIYDEEVGDRVYYTSKTAGDHVLTKKDGKTHYILASALHDDGARISPKFEKFSDEENYYKLLEDFDVYDTITGEHSGQDAVNILREGAFPADFKEVLAKSLKEEQKNADRFSDEFNENVGGMRDEIMNVIKSEYRKKLNDIGDIQRDSGQKRENTLQAVKTDGEGISDRYIDTPFEINPELKMSIQATDEAYMEAVNRGDMQTAQEMVKAAAMEADYLPVTRYHQTGERFTVFSNDNPVAALNDSETPNGFFFKRNDHDIGVGADYVKTGRGGDIQMSVYLKMNNPLYFKNREEARTWYADNIPGYKELLTQLQDNSTAIREFEKENDKKMFDELNDLMKNGIDDASLDAEIMDKYDKIFDDFAQPYFDKETELRGKMRNILNEYFLNGNSKYDGIELEYDGHRYIDGKRENVHTYIVFKNTQVKSADAVTYDNNGNVIPLSQRFNEGNKDIRYSILQDDPYERYYADVIEENRTLQMIFAQMGDVYATKRQGTELNTKDIDRIARKILKDKNSSFSKDSLAGQLTTIFDYYKQTAAMGRGDKDTTMKSLMRLARDVLMESKALDTEVYDSTKEVRDYLRKQHIYITEEQKNALAAEFGSWRDVQRAFMGKTILTTNEQYHQNSLDGMWSTLNSMAPEYFPADGYASTAAGDINVDVDINQFIALAAFFDTVKPRVYMPFSERGESGSMHEGEFAAEIDDAAADLALQMLNDMNKVGKLKTESEKYADYKYRLDKRTTELRQELRKTARAKMEEDSTRLFNGYRERLQEYKHNRERREQRAAFKRQVDKNVAYLNRRIQNPTNSRHIPEELGPLAKAMVKAVPEGNARFSRHNWNELLNQYSEYIRSNPMYKDADGELKDGAARMVNTIREFINQHMPEIDPPATKADLTLHGENQLADITEHIKHLVDTENQLFGDRRQEKVSDMGALVHSQFSKAPISKSQGQRKDSMSAKARIREGLDAFRYGLTKPEYLFMDCGSTALYDMYKDIRRSENKEAEFLRDAKAELDRIRDKWHYDTRWATDNVTVHTIEGDINVPTETIMALYATSKRQKGLEHILGDGVELWTRKDSKRQNSMTASADAKNEKNSRKGRESVEAGEIVKQEYHFTQQSLDVIFDNLPDEQKSYVDDVVGYLTKSIGQMRNNVSMELYGYKMYNEPYYFPIKTDPNYRDAILGRVETTSKIENQSSAKKTVKGARNRIIIEGFTDTAVAHLYDSALYCAYAIPLNNFNRVYNYRQRGTEENAWQEYSIANDIFAVMGKNGQREVRDFLTAADSGLRGDLMPLNAKMMSMAKKATTMANLSVVVQQPTAVFRAMLYIEPKYFATVAKKADIEEMYANNGCAFKKDLGYFDVNMGRSATDWLSEYESGKDVRADFDAADKRKEFFRTAGGKIEELAGWGASKADEITWGAIWNACKKKVNKEQNLKGEAQIKAAAELFQDAIAKTQVYDSIFTKPDYMRRKEGFAMMATQFMSEPLTSLNMLGDSLHKVARDKSTANKRFVGRAFACYVASLVTNALAKSIIYTIRSKDDDDSFLEKYITNIIDGMSGDVFGMVPYMGDIYNSFQGWDPSRLDTNWLTNFTQLGKILTNDKKTLTEKLGATFKTMGFLTGIPAYNVYRDTEALVRTGVKIYNGMLYKISDGKQGKALPETTGKGIINTLKENFDWLPLVDPESDYERIYNDIINNDTVDYERMVNQLTSDGKHDMNEIRSNLATILEQDDDRVGKAFTASMNGKLKEYDDLRDELKSAGFDDLTIDKAIKRHENKLKTSIAEDERIEQAAQARYERRYDDYEKIVNDIAGEDNYPRDMIVKAVESAKIALEADEYEKYEFQSKQEYDSKYDLVNAVSFGNPADVDRVVKELKSQGEDQADIYKDVLNKVNAAYKDGDITMAQAESYYKKYSDLDEDKRYWKMQELEAQKNGNKDWNKNDKFFAAIDAGKASDITASIKQLREHGVSNQSIASSITSQYKDQYIELYNSNPEEARKLKKRLLDAYYLIDPSSKNYQNAKKSKDIDKWIK